MGLADAAEEDVGQPAAVACFVEVELLVLFVLVVAIPSVADVFVACDVLDA